MDEKQLPQYAIELQEAVKREGLSLNEAARAAGLNLETFRDVFKGKITKVDNIYPKTRKRVYDRFKIRSFYTPYLDPVDTERDDAPTQLMKFIFQEYGGSIMRFAKENKLTETSIRYFVQRETKFVRSHISQRLYEITGYEVFNINSSKKIVPEKREVEKEKKPELKPHTQAQDIVSKLTELNSNIQSLRISIANELPHYETSQLLSLNSALSLEDRMQIVEKAIDILALQMEYFKTAPQKERESLIKYLHEADEINRWGYVVNILGGLSKPGNTPDTFARTLQLPTKREKK